MGVDSGSGLRVDRAQAPIKFAGPEAFRHRRQLGAQAGRLDALSPLKVLDRGYSVVINKTNSRAVLDAATVKFDDELDIRLAKGRLSARATGRSL